MLARSISLPAILVVTMLAIGIGPIASAEPIADLFERVSPAVVQVSALDGAGKSVGRGSGFVFSCDSPNNCVVFTNYHVIRAACALKVTFVDGRIEEVSEIVAENPRADLAILRITSPEKPLPAKIIELTGKELPRVGTRVIAIGNPKGLVNSLSDGLVAGYRLRDGDKKWLQITAPISPGSSGGPVFTHDGSLVGIATASMREGQNLNFAIPESDLLTLRDAGLESRPVCKGASVDFDLHEVLRNILEPVYSEFNSEYPDVLSPYLAWYYTKFRRLYIGGEAQKFRSYCDALASQSDLKAQLLLGWVDLHKFKEGDPKTPESARRAAERIILAVRDGSDSNKKFGYYLAGNYYLAVRSAYSRQMNDLVDQDHDIAVGWAYMEVFTSGGPSEEELRARPETAKRYTRVLPRMRVLHESYTQAGKLAKDSLEVSYRIDPRFSPAIEQLVFVFAGIVTEAPALEWADKLVDVLPRDANAYALRGSVRKSRH